MIGQIENTEQVEDADKELREKLCTLKANIDEKIDHLQVSKALEEIFEVLRLSNKYIDDTAPWILAKDETKKTRLQTVLYNLLEAIRITAILLKAFVRQL